MPEVREGKAREAVFFICRVGRAGVIAGPGCMSDVSLGRDGVRAVLRSRLILADQSVEVGRSLRLDVARDATAGSISDHAVQFP